MRGRSSGRSASASTIDARVRISWGESSTAIGPPLASYSCITFLVCSTIVWAITAGGVVGRKA